MGKPVESTNVQIATITPSEAKVDENKKEENTETGKNADNSEPTKKFCAARLNELDIEADMFLVGDIFMRKFYTVFDRDNDRVGLARSITKTSEMPDASLPQESKPAEVQMAESHGQSKDLFELSQKKH